MVHATDGEGGAIAEGSGATRETLGAVRRVEDTNAWRVLGRSPYRQEWFGYPDGGVPDVSFDELVDRVATVLGEERPDVVATFGPDGITGHPDHIRIGEAATAAFLRFAGDGGPGFRRLVYGGIRQSVIDRWNQRRVTAVLRGEPARPIPAHQSTRETQVIAWPPVRPGRVLTDVFEDL